MMKVLVVEVEMGKIMKGRFFERGFLWGSRECRIRRWAIDDIFAHLHTYIHTYLRAYKYTQQTEALDM